MAAFAPYYTVRGSSIRVPHESTFPMDQCAVFSLYDMKQARESGSDAWWQLIAVSVTEDHAENVDLHETLANSIVSFACGPRPVSVTISGYLLTGGQANDHYGEFFYRYLEEFRAKKLGIEDRVLRFSCRGTSCLLFIETLGVNHSSGQDEYVEVYIEGYACHYSAGTVMGSSLTPGQESAMPMSASFIETVGLSRR